MSRWHLHRYQAPLTKALPLGQNTLHHREGLILSGNGICVEIAPLPEFSKESLADCVSALTRTREHLNAERLPLPLNEWMAPFALVPPAVAWGLSLLWAKANQLLPARLNSQRQPLLHGDSNQIAEQLKALPSDTLQVKLKASPNVERTVQQVYQVLEQLPKARFRIDANQSLSFEQAEQLYAMLPKAHIDYIEEPTASIAEAQRLFDLFGIRYAVDETLVSQGDFQVHDGLVALVIKPMLLGSLERLDAIADKAQHCGVSVVISASFESSLGLNDLGKIAEHYAPSGIMGLDTLGAFASDIAEANGFGFNDRPLLTIDELHPVWP
ncbi:o-succinylbenzoate synthase [Paraferrimonas sedimenticola]|uniref:o-succinylbenzoate synthase n=1 Tax=Paraferrimonas sedimenticola TaxID=375674 RepID=A0AA37W0C8_9GAMM|nr:o-succinylbenzoate synthase [Paraferrimonas sedimenticola]GLP97824.1 o-succinylbenzoate synthase [Paraferrimonas sedimenticola]